MMDPAQIQMMQQMGILGSQMGVPGMYQPVISSGVNALQQTAQTYAPPTLTPGMPDTTPLAPFGLQNYGILGTMAGLAGNAALTNQMQSQGVIPMGNAGSFMQANRVNQFQQMQQQVAGGLASQDADSFYRTFEGMAALTGQPMNREQRQAGRRIANTIAQYGPTIAAVNPGLLDAMAGPTGSVQAMAAQMMQANRFQIDPTSGAMGFDAESNQRLIGNVFDELYSRDNMAQMNGIRAGEAGQLYSNLASRGLLGTPGSLRERTMDFLGGQSRQRLDAIGAESGVQIGNVEDLSFQDLEQIRGTEAVQQGLTQADTGRISDRLRGYSDSISALREVFGENGNPNAPVPLLIQSLEALTQGQMQKFDAASLNKMVRDMQAMSQVSGKSIDQLAAMQQQSNASLVEMGMGRHSAHFAPTGTRLGAAQGAAFAQQGGVTGFGAINREQAEQGAQSLFARGMASEAGNMYATLGRINDAGGFDDNTDAGKRLQAIHDAALSGRQTYVDPVDNQEKPLPQRESEVRRLIAQGGATGVGLDDYNMMLGDRTTNLRMMADDERYQTVATNLQAVEFRNRAIRNATNRTQNMEVLRGLAPEQRHEAATAMSTAATDAFFSADPQDMQDSDTRRRVMSEAIMREAGNRGVAMSEAQAEAMAEQQFGQIENTATQFGFEGGATEANQMLSPRAVENRRRVTDQARARARTNEAMSNLGPKGSMTQRLFDAVQKQGDDPDEAGIDKLMFDMLGVEDLDAKEKLVPELQEINKQKDELEALEREIASEDTTAKRRQELREEIDRKADLLDTRTAEFAQTTRSMGIDAGEGRFGLEDVAEARGAARNLEHLTRTDQVRNLARSDESTVREEELEAIADETMTPDDFRAIGAAKRRAALDAVADITSQDIEDFDPKDEDAPIGMTKELRDKYLKLTDRGVSEENARNVIRKDLERNIASEEEYATKEAKLLGSGLTIGQAFEGDLESQKDIIRARRADRSIIPTAEATDDRIAALKAGGDFDDAGEGQMTDMAEEQLIAEGQLRALGLLADDESLLGDEFSQMDGKLADRLTGVDVADRAGAVSGYIDELSALQIQRGEEGRVDALQNLQTPAGERSIRETRQNLETMTDLRQKLLMDEDAISRLGGARALKFVEASKLAEENLQTMANNYGFNGNVAAMIASDFVASDAEGMEFIEEEFENLSDEDLEKAEKVLGKDIESVDDYREFLRVRMRDNLGMMDVANAGMSGGATDKLLAADLGVSEEQLKGIEGLVSLESTIEKDSEAAAERLGMTQEEYENVAFGGEEFDESMLLFKGEHSSERLREAQLNEKDLEKNRNRLQGIDAEIARAKDAGGTPSQGLLDKRQELLNQQNEMVEFRNDQMKQAGLDPSDEDDVRRYDTLLANQGAARQLQQRRDDIAEKRSELIKQGLSPEEIDEKLGMMHARDEEAREKLEAFKKADISDADASLARALGIDTTEVTDELREFKSQLGDRVGEGQASERNQKMLSEALSTAGGLDIDGENNIVKLDKLTDAYQSADSKGRKALAMKHGMDMGDLDSMMRRTEFLGLENIDMEGLSSGEQQEAVVAGLERSMGHDIEKEVAAEEERQLQITGTVNVTGVVQGEGTFDDVTGATVR
jgi:hypothetical protein